MGSVTDDINPRCIPILVSAETWGKHYRYQKEWEVCQYSARVCPENLVRGTLVKIQNKDTALCLYRRCTGEYFTGTLEEVLGKIPEKQPESKKTKPPAKPQQLLPGMEETEPMQYVAFKLAVFL